MGTENTEENKLNCTSLADEQTSNKLHIRLTEPFDSICGQTLNLFTGFSPCPEQNRGSGNEVREEEKRGKRLSEQSLTDTDQQKARETKPGGPTGNQKNKQTNKKVSVHVIFLPPFCVIALEHHLAVTLVFLVYYLVGVGVSECRVVLARTVGGPVFVHGGGGRGFVQ